MTKRSNLKTRGLKREAAYPFTRTDTAVWTRPECGRPSGRVEPLRAIRFGADVWSALRRDWNEDWYPALRGVGGENPASGGGRETNAPEATLPRIRGGVRHSFQSKAAGAR